MLRFPAVLVVKVPTFSSTAPFVPVGPAPMLRSPFVQLIEPSLRIFRPRRRYFDVGVTVPQAPPVATFLIPFPSWAPATQLKVSAWSVPTPRRFPPFWRSTVLSAVL